MDILLFVMEFLLLWFFFLIFLLEKLSGIGLVGVEVFKLKKNILKFRLLDNFIEKKIFLIFVKFLV